MKTKLIAIIQIVIATISLVLLGIGLYFRFRNTDLPYDEFGSFAHFHDDLLALLFYLISGVTFLVDALWVGIGAIVLAVKKKKENV